VHDEAGLVRREEDRAHVTNRLTRARDLAGTPPEHLRDGREIEAVTPLQIPLDEKLVRRPMRLSSHISTLGRGVARKIVRTHDLCARADYFLVSASSVTRAASCARERTPSLR
jgi:hypothetical protein